MRCAWLQSKHRVRTRLAGDSGARNASASHTTCLSRLSPAEGSANASLLLPRRDAALPCHASSSVRYLRPPPQQETGLQAGAAAEPPLTLLLATTTRPARQKAKQDLSEALALAFEPKYNPSISPNLHTQRKHSWRYVKTGQHKLLVLC